MKRPRPGLLQPHATIAFVPYLDEWVERYRGQGRGSRENTRDEYRRLIQAHAHHYFSKRLKLTDVTTYELARFVDWLADETDQGKCLANSMIAKHHDAAAIGARHRGAGGTDPPQVGAPWAGFHAFRHTFVRVSAPEQWDEHRPAESSAWPSLAGIHVLALHPPAPRR